MLIELFEGFFVNPDDVSVVKAMGKKTSALFTVGQSAVDGGFTVPYRAKEVVERVNDACEQIYGETFEEPEGESEAEPEDEDE
jgi:coenzyme F420-reducing hydrogenase gamma subunit